jgi:NAD(P)-dependent dehydrogenase (short-subunit alcohol dehydrogenase family)
MIDLSGKTALVTGGASGIGRACVEQYLQLGARVLSVDINAAAIAAMPEHQSLTHLAGDLGDSQDLARVIAEASNTRLDILVNAAGICPVVPWDEMTGTHWQQVMQVNLDAVFKLCHAVTPVLKCSPAGRIINIGSVMSDFAAPGLAAYTVSKHGIVGLTKALATELGAFGITVNCINPGAIRTGITADQYENDADFRAFWAQRAALGRWGEPQDVARLAAFIASDAAAFISGHSVYVDGAAMQQV